jgi:hypothetical protein
MVAALFSCQKSISDFSTSSATGNSLVKTYTEDVVSTISGHSVTTFNLSYDASNRLTSMVSANSPGDKFIYTYGSGNSLTLDIYNAAVLEIHETSYLNSNGLADSTFQYNNTGDTSTEKYLYNAAKQQTQLKEYTYTKLGGSVPYNTHIYTFDNAGKVVKDVDNTTVSTFQYGSQLNTLNMGVPYLTVGKYLPVSSTYNDGASNINFTFNYTFDSNNRRTSDKITVSTGDIITKTYTY